MGVIDSPVRLRHIECPNRVIRSATHDFLGTKDGHMTDAEYAMYEGFASGGVGLIITGHCCVMDGGLANRDQTRISDDSYIEQFRRLVDIVHSHGALIVPQISHAGPRAVDTDDFADASAGEVRRDRMARALSVTEIEDIEKAFIAAAYRLKKAGVDGVQLHAAHSYLLSRFIDPTFNHREDEYGGSVGNRFRIVENIVCGIKETCGDDFPVLMKINSDTKADDEAYTEDLKWIVERSYDIGVELIEFSGVDFINLPRMDRLFYLDRAAAMKRAVPKMPMSLVGGVRSLAEMEKVIESGLDMVSLSRALIAEPDFLKQVHLDTEHESPCLSCNRCFVLPNMHPGVRCVREWKKIRDRRKALNS